MRREWEDDPKLRARVWTAWRLAAKDIGPTVIADALDCSVVSVWNYLNRAEAVKEAVGVSGVKELLEHDAIQAQVDVLAQAAVNLTSSATKEKHRPRTRAQIVAAVSVIEEALNLGRQGGDDVAALEAQLQDVKAKLRKKEAVDTLAKAVKATGDPIEDYLDDVRRLVQASNTIDDVIFGKDSGRS
jgi:hypothetical protein